MQSLSVKELLGKAQDKVVKQCRKVKNNTLYPQSKDYIAEHLCWASNGFERQERINKARCETISSIRKENCDLKKELAAQKKINQANSKRIRALEKILKLKPSPVIKEVVDVSKNEPNFDDGLVLPELPPVPTKPVLKSEMKEESTELNDAPTTPVDEAENEVSKKKISFGQKCRRVFRREERKWVITHECIEKNIDWADQRFDRQEVINKNLKADLSELKKESCAIGRDLTVQSKMNEENTKRIDALEKLLSVKESSTGNLITKESSTRNLITNESTAGNLITKVVQTVVDPKKLLSVKESSTENLITKEPLAGNLITKDVQTVVDPEKLLRVKESLAGNLITNEPLAGNLITKDVETVVAPVMSISDPVLCPSTDQVVDQEANNCDPITLDPVSSSVSAPNYQIPTAPMSGKLTLLMSKEDQPRYWLRENGKWVPLRTISGNSISPNDDVPS